MLLTDAMLNNGFYENGDSLTRDNDDSKFHITETYCEDTGRVDGYSLELETNVNDWRTCNRVFITDFPTLESACQSVMDAIVAKQPTTG